MIKTKKIKIIKNLGKRMYGGMFRIFYLCKCECGNEFESANTSLRQRIACVSCARKIGASKSSISRTGQKRSNLARLKMSKARKAYFKRVGGYPEETKAKQRLRRGDVLYNWKGNDAGYSALHCWVKLWLGKPKTCEHCKTTGLTGYSIHWANKSGLYKRELSDWIRLCAKCHKKYDAKKGLGKIRIRFPSKNLKTSTPPK